MCCLSSVLNANTRKHRTGRSKSPGDGDVSLFLRKHARHQPPSATSVKQFTYVKKGDFFFFFFLPASYSLQLPLRPVGLIYINID